MGCYLSKSDELECRAQVNLIRAYYQTGITYSYNHSKLRIRKMYLDCNTDYKDIKEISMLRKTSTNCLLETKAALGSMSLDSSKVNKLGIDLGAVDLTEFSSSSKKLEKFVADDIEDQIEKTYKLKETMKERGLRLERLKERFRENKVKLEFVKGEERKPSHKKSVSSGNFSAATNSSFDLYNYTDEGDLTDRSLERSLAKLNCVSNLGKTKSDLLSKILLKSELLKTYTQASSTLDHKLKASKANIKALESELNDSPSPLGYLDVLKNKIKVLESQLENEKSEAKSLKSCLSSGSKFINFQAKQLEILEKQISNPLSFLV